MLSQVNGYRWGKNRKREFGSVKKKKLTQGIAAALISSGMLNDRLAFLARCIVRGFVRCQQFFFIFFLVFTLPC